MSVLPVAGCRLVNLPVRGDDRGSLIPVEEGNPLPFPIQRVYHFYGTGPGVSRGFHAHRKLRQWAIAISGSCTFVLDDGSQRLPVRLDRPDRALELGPMIWREIHDLSPDAVVMVLADSVYDEGDYIRSYDDFRAMLEGEQNLMVPFLDLAAATDELQGEISDAVGRVVRSGWYIGGTEVARFEEHYASYCGADHCVGVGNGLDALHLTLRAMDIGPGDEVIVASNGFIATWLAVSMTGATPVPVEPDPQTHNLDPALVEAAITGRTRVILPTHLYGQPADVDPLLEIARRSGLRLVEDAAQAHGARYKGRRLGAHGDAVTWSFYPSKNLGALGDAGAVTTNDADLARRIRELGNYGSARRYVNDVKGVNSRLDPIHAAVLAAKLDRLDEWNDRRRRIAALYLEKLGRSGLTLPFVPNWAEPVWHLFVVQSDARDALAGVLEHAGIQTLVHYPIPPHRQQAYSDMAMPEGSLPIAERLARSVLSLPIGPHLSGNQAEQVVEAVNGFAGASPS